MPATRNRNPSSPPFKTATHEIHPNENTKKATISNINKFFLNHKP